MSAILRALLLIALGALSAGCQPSPEAVGGKVQSMLQQKLDTTFGAGAVEVAGVVAVHEDGNKYQGVANLSAFGGSMTLKLSILADKSNVLYEAAAPDWTALVSSVNQQKVKAVEGKYSDVAVTNDSVFSCFPEILKRDKDKFAERLATVVPVKAEANFWFGSGCKAHECGTEEAAWVIDNEKAKGYAVILSEGRAGPTFSTYGGEPEELPFPLLAWALEKGMSPYNSVAIRPHETETR